ncbi:hypothetical protein Xsto_02997 [Xenorhabdus stockiae]|uniref:Uncharacterized protein n=1 Tax=Xenorhabdus stockiae TaxID=351614 RepID=A0A2D0KM34_9GAMM|nr:hypothetical protein [Xenorhabdus stockiae]PHM64462.1 hypothetical protein Xsto_02997 [Xenorhabdus stockiae]
MKQLTALERSKLQLTMMARLHDVFGDIKDEVEVTPEFIQNTLAQFIQVVTDDNEHMTKFDEDSQFNETLLREISLCMEDALHRYAVWERESSKDLIEKISRLIHYAFLEYGKDNGFVIYGLPTLRGMISFGIDWTNDEESLKLWIEKHCLMIKQAFNQLFEGLAKGGNYLTVMPDSNNFSSSNNSSSE